MMFHATRVESTHLRYAKRPLVAHFWVQEGELGAGMGEPKQPEMHPIVRIAPKRQALRLRSVHKARHLPKCADLHSKGGAMAQVWPQSRTSAQRAGAKCTQWAGLPQIDSRYGSERSARCPGVVRRTPRVSAEIERRRDRALPRPSAAEIKRWPSTQGPVPPPAGPLGRRSKARGAAAGLLPPRRQRGPGLYVLVGGSGTLVVGSAIAVGPTGVVRRAAR